MTITMTRKMMSSVTTTLIIDSIDRESRVVMLCYFVSWLVLVTDLR